MNLISDILQLLPAHGFKYFPHTSAIPPFILKDYTIIYARSIHYLARDEAKQKPYVVTSVAIGSSYTNEQ